ARWAASAPAAAPVGTDARDLRLAVPSGRSREWKPARAPQRTRRKKRTQRTQRTQRTSASLGTAFRAPVNGGAIGRHQVLLGRRLHFRCRHLLQVGEDRVDAVRVVVVKSERGEQI